MNKSVALLLVLVFLTASCVAVKPALSSADVTEDSWVEKAPMQEARAHFGVAAVNGKIYAIGGDVGSEIGNVIPGWGHTYNVASTNEEYDPVSNAWIYKAPMPTARARFGIAAYQNKIYCIGGYYATVTYKDGRVDKTEYFNTGINEVYDPATDTWEPKASMPVPSRSTTANVVNGKIYLIGDDLNEVYDIAADSWAMKTPPPYEITSYASVVVDDKIYFIGTETNSSGLWTEAFFQIYDPLNDSWSIGSNSPTYGVAAASGATTGVNAPKQIYFFEETTTYSYNLTNDSWTIGTSMPTARLIATIVVIGDIFYVVGGRYGQHGYITIMFPSAVNEQYTPIGYRTPDPSSPSPSPTTYPAPSPTHISEPTSTSEPQSAEPFSTTMVITSVALATLICIGLLVYFKKRKR